MLSEALPIYSGGLGNVAGDQLEAASDLDGPHNHYAVDSSQSHCLPPRVQEEVTALVKRRFRETDISDDNSHV
ncbi:MAG: hypothetical protein ACLQVX_03085 [Limisphaerales bacterium]